MSTSPTLNSDTRGSLTAKDLYAVVSGWLAAMEEHRDEINALNVFPVPDGDTGTNMFLTLQTVRDELKACRDKTVAGYSNGIKEGSLKGARGNSGVILSQILRGMCDVIIETPEVDAKTIGKALTTGSNVAYEAVMKPVEGTMLTVIKDIARAARRASRKSEDVIEVLEMALKEGKASLARTPELLATLKDAGVVDAGGKGIVIMAESALATLTGDTVWLEPPLDYVETPAERLADAADAEEELDLEYTYCTEFMLKGEHVDMPSFRDEIARLGGSLLVVGDNGVVKTHIHTNDPGLVLAAATSRGELTGLKIDNMREQSRQRSEKQPSTASGAPPKPLGVIAVAVGKGNKQILRSLGTTAIVDGGQTMNPAAAEIVEAVENLNAESAIILPNNKNIILTAKQAAELTDKPLFVVPTTAVTEAFTALLSLDENRPLAEVGEAMTKAISGVKTGEVTWASRDLTVNKKKIKRGDVIGIASGSLIASGKTVNETAMKLIKAMMDKDSEVVTLIRGVDMPEAEAAVLAGNVEAAYPDAEVHVYDGGQPLYPLIIGVE